VDLVELLLNKAGRLRKNCILERKVLHVVSLASADRERVPASELRGYSWVWGREVPELRVTGKGGSVEVGTQRYRWQLECRRGSRVNTTRFQGATYHVPGCCVYGIGAKRQSRLICCQHLMHSWLPQKRNSARR